MSARRPALLPILLFYSIAGVWSWSFELWMTLAPQSWAQIPLPGFLRASLFMWGPGIAALVVITLFRDRPDRRVRFAGGRRWGSAAFFLAPLFVLGALTAALAGPKAAFGLVFLFGPIGFFNTLGEELGWRGFLQDALRPWPWYARYLVVGLLWELWHWPVRLAMLQHGEVAWYAGVLPLALSTLLFAFILGAAADRSRSLVVPVTLHFWVNGVRELPAVLTIPAGAVYASLAVALVYWGWLLWQWRPADEARILDSV